MSGIITGANVISERKLGKAMLGSLIGVLAFAGLAPAVVGVEPIAVGAKAPIWRDLPGTDGKTHSLSDLAKAKAVLVVFTCNECPYAVAYEDRINQIAKEYASKNVAVVAINPNKSEGEDLATMKKRAEEKGFAFPYLSDGSQKVAESFGAKVTPHVFLLDEQRQVAYVGALDDAKTEAKVTQRYARAALDSVLNNQKPKIAKTRAAGCSIRYE